MHRCPSVDGEDLEDLTNASVRQLLSGEKLLKFARLASWWTCSLRSSSCRELARCS